MKRFIALLLTLLLAVSFTACGIKKSNQQTNENGQEDIGFERGTVDGNTYTSSFLGLTATMPEGWAIASDEEMAQIMGMVADAMTNDGANKQMENGGTVCDFYAIEQNVGSNVNINVEKLNIMTNLFVDVDGYVDAAIEQLPDAMQSIGVTISNIEKTTLSFAGENNSAITLQADNNGIPMYETLVVLKRGSYAVTITAATYYEDATLAILDLFQKKA